MKYEQAFHIVQDVATVWQFFEQFEKVAQCMPGMQKIEIVDPDNVVVTLTQRLGPMAATFEARVQITERVERERIAFSSTGKAVRGAIGNFRSTNTVSLSVDGDQTRVVVVGDVALGGALGSVGQKVIAKLAEKVTTEFAQNLERVLSGADRDADQPPVQNTDESVAAPHGPREGGKPAAMAPAPLPSIPAAALNVTVDPWSRVSAALSGAALLVSLIVLWHVA